VAISPVIPEREYMSVSGSINPVIPASVQEHFPYISIYDIIHHMIRNINGKTTQDIFDGYNSRQSRTVPQALHAKARRLLDQINTAPGLEFLNVPPGNRLEKLRGQLAGYWSVRINDQWRIIFKWKENDALDVEIVDYHD